MKLITCLIGLSLSLSAYAKTAGTSYSIVDCQIAAYSSDNGDPLVNRGLEAVPSQGFGFSYPNNGSLNILIKQVQGTTGPELLLQGKANGGRSFFKTQGMSAVFGNPSSFGFLRCDAAHTTSYYFRTAQGEAFTVPWKKGRNLRSLLTSRGTCIVGSMKEADADLSSSFEFGSAETLDYDSQKGLSWSDVKMECSKFEEPQPGEPAPAKPNCLEWKEHSRVDYLIPPC